MWFTTYDYVGLGILAAIIIASFLGDHLLEKHEQRRKLKYAHKVILHHIQWNCFPETVGDEPPRCLVFNDIHAIADVAIMIAHNRIPKGWAITKCQEVVEKQGNTYTLSCEQYQRHYMDNLESAGNRDIIVIDNDDLQPRVHIMHDTPTIL
jgi:hypothetical protein